MNQKERFLILINKLENNTTTQEELRELDAIYETFDENEDYIKDPRLDHHIEHRERLFREIQRAIEIQQKRKTKYLFKQVGIAAMLMCFMAISIQFFYIDKPVDLLSTKKQLPISPKDEQTTLTLANGKKITLFEMANDDKLKDAGIKIVKKDNGQVYFQIDKQFIKNDIKGKSAYNILTTAKGEQCQLILPDNSIVWLNSGSTIRYPVSFEDHSVRKIELNGEAYFEIVKNEHKPFEVLTDKTAVTVLGTHFNIYSYSNDEFKATLLEGAIKIKPKLKKNWHFLKPGQEALLRGDELRITNVNSEESIAWKDGYFIFNNEDISVVMKKLERYYDFKTEYRGGIPIQKIGGTFSRTKSLKEFLNYLITMGAEFSYKIEGRSVIIMK